MSNRSLTAVALLSLLIACAIPVLSEEGCTGFLTGYSFYQGAWPAGPHYKHIQLTYEELNPMNVARPEYQGYWPYPSPFVMFPEGERIDPLKLPLSTIGDNYAMGSTDAKLYQQWACYGNSKGLYTFWYFLRTGPEPAPGDVLPPNCYFMRPYPYEGQGNYYIIFNEVFENCCDAAASPRTIGFWKNWDNRYTAQIMDNLIQSGSQATTVLAGVNSSNLKTTIHSAKTMEERARAQLIATWLNVFSGKLGLALYVDVSSIPNWQSVLTGGDNGKFTVNDVLYQIEAKRRAGGLTATQWEAIKSIADAINNEMILVSS